VLQFGTEVVTAADGSIAGLLGASPGASTAVSIMLGLLKTCFADRIDEWEPRLRDLIPSYGETLNNELGGRIPVFFLSPGLVRTEMTSSAPDDAPWTPPELAPRLVRALASGRADALAGRYIHAEHDDIDDLIRRVDEIRERDLNSIRLQR
jgi:hypothetical protein